jgi:hypothetical protein
LGEINPKRRLRRNKLSTSGFGRIE